MFEEFLEGITVAGKPLEPERQAYRMDGNQPDPDMRKEAGLSTCHCCDYFIFGSGNNIILIEETRLSDQIGRLMQEFHYLDDVNRKDHVTKLILDENTLKAYGSLLVLCRLFCSKEDGSSASSLDARYSFWLVASATEPTDDAIALDHIRGQLVRKLRSILGAIVHTVEVVPADALSAKLESVEAFVSQA